MKYFFAILAALFYTEYVSADDVENFHSFEPFEPKYPNDLDSNRVLKQFLKFTNEHKFNLTVVFSSTTVWPNGVPKDISGISINLPSNDEQLTFSHYTVQAATPFLKLAAKEKLTANARRIYITDHSSEVETEKVVTNNPGGTPECLVYRTLTNIQNGIRGLAPTEDNYYARYNFIIPDGDKNRTTEVLFSDIKVEVINDSEFSAEELAFARETVTNFATIMEDDEDAAEIIAKSFNSRYSDWEWNVLVGEGTFSLSSSKYAVISAYDQDYAIVALPK